MIVGIDVGGANTKIATSEGFVKSLYAPLWKNKASLYDVLSEVSEAFAPRIEAVGVVMTGELCDCFETRREGVVYIKNALISVFNNVHVHFFDTTCTFKSSSEVDGNPLLFASTNWLASSKFISQQYKDALFIDLGSTTTDVIPIVGGKIKAEKTDLERLIYHELIYSGILRTNIATVLKKVTIGEAGEECSTSSELFALTADAYLVLDYITAGEYTCEAPDGYAFFGREDEAKSRISAMRRLARVVCSDFEEIGEGSAVSIAAQVMKAQVEELAASMEELKDKYDLKIVVSAGIGDFIVQEATDLLQMHFIPLSALYSKKIAATFPAYAVAQLLAFSLKKL
jgi:probable H4MPT-linked C1 transfer pathway protein